MTRNPFDTFGTVKEHDYHNHKFQNADGKTLDTLDSILEDNLDEINKMKNETNQMMVDSVYDKWASMLEDSEYTTAHLEKLFKHKILDAADNITRYRNVGLFFSAAYNRIADDESVCAFIDTGVSWIDYFGYKHSKGELTLSGDRFSHVAESMANGNIIVKKGMDNIIGTNMSGGIIKIRDNASVIGHGMSGGSIIAHGDFYVSVGQKMAGGNICVDGTVRESVGYQMIDGSIVVKKDVKKHAGTQIKGGKIEVFGAVDGNVGASMIKGHIKIHGDVSLEVGTEMHDGSIEIMGNVVKHIGKGMVDGNISVQGTVSANVAHHMVGGNITIHESLDSKMIGNQMSGGSVSIKGSTGINSRVGHGMSGGLIEVEGDAGYVGGSMDGGFIHVSGDALNHVGSHMGGGNLIIRGNVAGSLGFYMRFGNITLEGIAVGEVGESMKDGSINLSSVGSLASGPLSKKLIFDINPAAYEHVLGENQKGGMITLEHGVPKYNLRSKGEIIFNDGDASLVDKVRASKMLRKTVRGTDYSKNIVSACGEGISDAVFISAFVASYPFLVAGDIYSEWKQNRKKKKDATKEDLQ